VIRRPIDKALRTHFQEQALVTQQGKELQKKGVWETLVAWWEGKEETEEREGEPEEELPRGTIRVSISKTEFARAFREAYPDAQFNLDAGPAGDEADPRAEAIRIAVTSPAFNDLEYAIDAVTKPITLNVQEGFMIYLKVALVAGLIFAFPWIAYQLWLFVAAGLYEHEKRYIYIFLPISMVLFFGGALFCYFGVFPFVLDFLLRFNDYLGVTPQIRLSEWISFALLLPLMFGISFQLPLVMYFVERLGIVSVQAYREKRRLAILIIATMSMFLTPAEPMSMVMMMVPLILLYELGIYFCRLNPARNPYEISES
jgi:sec-independent protein translocase protein TatC